MRSKFADRERLRIAKQEQLRAEAARDREVAADEAAGSWENAHNVNDHPSRRRPTFGCPFCWERAHR